MLVRFVFSSLVLFSCVVSWGAKEKKYPVAEIAQNLKEDANTVVRKREILLEIFSEENIKYTIKEAFTILNDKADRQAVLYIPYDASTKIDIDEANIFDGAGNLVKRFKKSEFYDQSYFDGFSLYSDARFKRITPEISTYPYTVEYEYTIEKNGVVDYYDWRTYDGYKKSIEKSSYEIRIYDDSEIKVKPYRIEAIKNGNQEENYVNYYWEVENLPALRKEPYSVSLSQFTSWVKIAPVNFSYYNRAGSLDSWKSYGDWAYDLIKDKNILPEERKAFIDEVMLTSSDTLDMIRKLYKHLQKETRYVSVQLGIGGYEPISALKVDEVKYGDCKALANYMKSMLDYAGIKSYYTIIKAGRFATEIDPEFPSQSFNHVILTVPLSADTLFLECTDQFSPFGYQGSFTADRYALLVDENNSHLIRTKKYTAQDNSWQLKAEINLTESGKATIFDTVVFRGAQFEDIEDELRKTKEKQIENEHEYSDIPGAKYLDISYKQQGEFLPSATRNREIAVENFAALMGKRMFVPVNVLNKRTSYAKKVKDRKYAFKTSADYIDYDTVSISIPTGFEIEYLPSPDSISTEFGSYTSELQVNGDKIIYCRTDERRKGTYPPEKYADYVAFRKKIIDADSKKIILKKL